jgi:1-acyl-sn-glycerol-3-phosphate acyltransferase
MEQPAYVDRRRVHGARARMAGLILALAGWRVVLTQPVPAKCVVVFYPHTSNWDFPVGLLAKWLTGIHFRWVGKDSMFVWPMRAAFERWGGIPVDRSARSGFIAAMQAAFAAHDDFRLVIAPEGTRARAERWRSGFWHLARAANVPVALAFIDYARREVGVGAYVEVSDDASADTRRIAAFYAGKVARRPGCAGPVTL